MDQRNVRNTGPGKYRNFECPAGQFYGRLYNFDIDGTVVKEEHRNWLDSNIVPFLKRRGSVTLEGLTSSTGSASHDVFLSQDRLANVEKYLRLQAVGPWSVQSRVAGGKKRAVDATGEKKEDEFWRAVDIVAWHSPAPPVLPDTPPKEISKVARIIRRTFEQLSTSRGQSNSNPVSINPLSPAADLLLNKGRKLIFSTDEDGENVKARVKGQFPVDWEVTRVEVDETYSVMQGLHEEESIFRRRLVSYVWGASQPFVAIASRFSWTTHIPASDAISGQGETSESHFIPRTEARESSFYTPHD